MTDFWARQIAEFQANVAEGTTATDQQMQQLAAAEYLDYHAARESGIGLRLGDQYRAWRRLESASGIYDQGYGERIQTQLSPYGQHALLDSTPSAPEKREAPREGDQYLPRPGEGPLGYLARIRPIAAAIEDHCSPAVVEAVAEAVRQAGEAAEKLQAPDVSGFYEQTTVTKSTRELAAEINEANASRLAGLMRRA